MLVSSFRPPYGNQEVLSNAETEIATLERSTTPNTLFESYEEANQNDEQTNVQKNQHKPARSTHFERVKQIFNSPTALRLLNIQDTMRAVAQRENSPPNTMWVEESSDSQHSTVYITPGSIRVIDRQLGCGGQGAVYEVTRLFQDSHKPNVKEALKFSSRLPSSRLILSEISSEECTNLNYSVQSYCVKPESPYKYCDVLPLADGDIHTFNLSTVKKPIQCMLNFMKLAADGARVLHNKNILHRDIKPHNIFQMEGGKKAQLGDLDLTIKEQMQEHRTACTPIYAHPSIWGNDLMKQVNRQGLQTKSDDAFALGRTMQYGFIERVFAFYSEQKPYLSSCAPVKRILKKEIEIEVLTKIAHEKNQVLIVTSTEKIQCQDTDKNLTKVIPKEILIYPSREFLNQENYLRLKKLRSKLDCDEYQALEFTVHLAYVLQSDTPSDRYSMQKTVELIEEFQNNLKNKPVDKPVSTSTQTRKRREPENASQSLPAKKQIRKFLVTED